MLHFMHHLPHTASASGVPSTVLQFPRLRCISANLCISVSSTDSSLPGTNDLSRLLQGRITRPHLLQVHARIFRLNEHQNNLIATRLIGHYPSNLALKVFYSLREPNIFPFNAIIRVLAEEGLYLKALLTFKELKFRRLLPNDLTFSFLLKACSRDGVGVDCVKQVHGHVVKSGFMFNPFVCNGLLMAHVKAVKDLVSARQVFDEMPDRNLVCCWTSLISGYARLGLAEESLKLFMVMLKENLRPESDTMALTLFKSMMENYDCRPNHVTMVSVLSACAEIGDLDLGMWVHNYMRTRGHKGVLSSNVNLATALINMYSKCGSLDEARKVFDQISKKDVVSFNAMIIGLAVNGEGEEALRLFSKMLEFRLCPDSGTLLGALCACSHSGLLGKGREIFKEMIMRRESCVTPKLEHYACYIDLLSRSGFIEEALGVATSMPFKPNNFVWGSLLSGCVLHNRLELAQVISTMLITVDPENSAGYVMLSNSFAADCEWRDVLKLRGVMKAKGVNKQPGRSWINIGGVMHEFVAGSASYLQIGSIHEMMQSLLKEMRLSSP
ncbi:Pentatricopeptide repeat-containing protein [Sesamum angolense]|uniref:Pentatricopeptide repeat-containing protein n=1 Tax=Sesamum angolense TaxID=2727404 RepID=A0AAE1WYD2_9LAMI|nr:Pentatricopeptide repeat-containing protein [Sesamum angolense]